MMAMMQNQVYKYILKVNKEVISCQQNQPLINVTF